MTPTHAERIEAGGRLVLVAIFPDGSLNIDGVLVQPAANYFHQLREAVKTVAHRSYCDGQAKVQREIKDALGIAEVDYSEA